MSRGRRPRSDEPSTERIEFVVTKAERAELSKVAHENALPVATMIREAVNVYVSDYRDGLVFIGQPKRRPSSSFLR